MPFKLIKKTDQTGASLWNVFNQRIADKYGIMFKNRVPAVEMFPEQFEKISLAEYNKIYSNNLYKQEIASANTLRKRK